MLGRQISLLNELPELFPNSKLLLVGHGTSLNTILTEFGYSANLLREEYRIINLSRFNLDNYSSIKPFIDSKSKSRKYSARLSLYSFGPPKIFCKNSLCVTDGKFFLPI